MKTDEIIIKGLKEQLANWENIFYHIKINSKGEWADATYYQLLEKRKLDSLKKISRALRNFNRKWIKDGNELKLIEGIVELDKEIYDEIEKEEANLKSLQ